MAVRHWHLERGQQANQLVQRYLLGAVSFGGGGGGGNYKLDLNGIWYPNGNRSRQCSIQQHRNVLNFQNETGDRATGSFDSKFHLSTNWSGTKIGGTVSKDGDRINWDNGTYWVRYRV